MSTVLRSVLGAGGSQTERGQDRKLLELPDLDGNDTPHSMDTSQADGEGGEGAEAAGPSAEAIASVVTQAPPAGVPNSPRTGAAPSTGARLARPASTARRPGRQPFISPPVMSPLIGPLLAALCWQMPAMNATLA